MIDNFGGRSNLARTAALLELPTRNSDGGPVNVYL